MSRRATTWLAYLVLALSVACYAFGLGIAAQTAVNASGMNVVDPIDLSLLTFAVAGAFIASQRPANAIGWIFAAMGLMWEVFAFAKGYAGYLALRAPGSLAALQWVLWLPLHLWIPWLGLLLYLILLFPNGRLLSTRWRPVIWFIGLFIPALLVTLGTSFQSGSTRQQFPSLLELVGSDHGGQVSAAFSDLLATFVFVPVLVVTGTALLLRAHRARADERARELTKTRAYMYALARLQLDPRLQGKIGISGAAQQTLMLAHQALA